MAAGSLRAPIERIGVIFIHGIGEQAAFEHLESGAVELVQALRAKEPGKRITASVNTTSDAIYKADRQTWRGEDCAPVWIDVTDIATGTFQRIELREVWWADLDEEAGWKGFVTFLWWGCTLWARPTYSRPNLDSFKAKLFTPRNSTDVVPASNEPDDAPIVPGILDRFQLFIYALLFILVLPTWYLLGLILRMMRISTFPSVRILVQYVGT